MSDPDLILHLDDDNFDEAMAKGIVLVDFYADWCGPCRMMTPVIEEFAQEMKGKIAVGKLDIDASQKVTQSFQVTSIPTLILFQGGQEVKRIVGLKDLDSLKKLVEAAVT
jgi:thioredoxin 1